MLDQLKDRLGLNDHAPLLQIDPNLIPLLENIALDEGLSLSETVNRLLSFAIGEHHATNENLTLWHTLTEREQETAALACLGYNNAEIASKMTISINTVKTHLRRVLQKFRVNSKAELQLILASWDFREWDNPDLDSAVHVYPDMG